VLLGLKQATAVRLRMKPQSCQNVVRDDRDDAATCTSVFER
jgi:hypothetical protein